MRLPIAASTATLLVAQVAFAQNASSDCNQAAGAEPEQNTAQAQQGKVERALQGAGFRDIEAVPVTFLVRAKNPEGKAVVIFIDPISMRTTIIENGQSAADDTTTVSASPPAPRRATGHVSWHIGTNRCALNFRSLSGVLRT